MPVEVLSYTCPRCKRGAFRSLPGADGKAYCPWCGDAVAAAPVEPPPPPTAEMFSLVDLAKRIAGDVPNPSAPSSPNVDARLAEAERRRQEVEAELRREQEKKQEIKKAVLEEMSRLEAELNDTKMRVRRKDEEHGSALEALNLLKESKQQEWTGERNRLQDTLEEKEKELRTLQARLDERQKSEADLQKLLDASRAELGKLRADAAAGEAERKELRRKLAAADARLQPLKDAEGKLTEAQRRLQESNVKASGLLADSEKKDQRIKDLQLLVKTLGDRLNQLADRRNV